MRVALLKLERFESLGGFGQWLREPRVWVGAFDFPFGLPRPLVEHLRWPTQWKACINHYASLSRDTIRATFAAYCDAPPPAPSSRIARPTGPPARARP